MQAERSASFPVARRSHKKSRTGCRTCRIRKVKCDETRPLCRNCERHFIGLKACDFDDQPVLITDNANSELVGREAEPLKSVTSGAATHLFAQKRPATELPASLIDPLVKHYLNSFAYHSFPFYANKILVETWWYFVCSDQVLFHVVMLLSSIDKDRSKGASSRNDTAQLYDQSLALLRMRLEYSSTAVSDATIVVVALLAAMEHDRENMRALDTHLSALKRAVEVRGGLAAIKASNILVANMVFWCALVSLDEPTLFSFTFDDDLPGIVASGLAGRPMLTTHDGKETDLLALGLDAETANVLYDVQRLSKHYTSTLTYDNVDEAMEVLSQLCMVLQRLITPSKSSVNEASIPGLSQSCRLAGCMHVFAPMSAYFPNPTLMLHSFVRDIKTSLTRMMDAVGAESHLLLWLLAVAGITAHSMPERKWFVGHLVVAITNLRIETWEEFRSHLVKLAFHDNFCDVSFQSLWEEVRKKEDVLGLVR